MQTITLIIFSLMFIVSDSFAFTANEIDISQFSVDISLVVVMILGVTLLLFGYRKVINLIGK